MDAPAYFGQTDEFVRAYIACGGAPLLTPGASAAGTQEPASAPQFGGQVAPGGTLGCVAAAGAASAPPGLLPGTEAHLAGSAAPLGGAAVKQEAHYAFDSGATSSRDSSSTAGALQASAGPLDAMHPHQQQAQAAQALAQAQLLARQQQQLQYLQLLQQQGAAGAGLPPGMAHAPAAGGPMAMAPLLPQHVGGAWFGAAAAGDGGAVAALAQQAQAAAAARQLFAAPPAAAGVPALAAAALAASGAGGTAAAGGAGPHPGSFMAGRVPGQPPGGAAAAGGASAAPLPLPPADEPDLSHLTVMQRYHARRKLAVQRMEREVEEKIAQLALLEQENRRLKWQAHILENMLLDIDKQLEVMSLSDGAPDASQWLTLLGMGQGAAGGRVARTVHRMLEGAGHVDVGGWTVRDCRRRWLAFLERLEPLLADADAAQQEYRAARPPPPQAEAAGGAGGGSRRPRRAAAAAVAAVVQQEAAEVLGVVPVPPSHIPEPPAPASAAQQQPAASADGSVGQHNPADLRAGSACSSGCDQAASGAGGEPPPAAHLVSVEGVPPALLAQIEELVLDNYYWLLAMMTTNPVLTYEFISMDLVDGTKPLPPQEDELWSRAVGEVQPTLDQMQECSTCIQVSRRCMAKVMEERAEIQESMQVRVESEMHTHLSEDVLQLNCRDAAVDRMRANVRKESVVRNMVGFYCINVFSLFQLAKISVACAPWFCMAWRVVGAIDERLKAQLAEMGRSRARGGGGGAGGGGHNTRSSARLAAQR